MREKEKIEIGEEIKEVEGKGVMNERNERGEVEVENEEVRYGSRDIREKNNRVRNMKEVEGRERE